MFVVFGDKAETTCLFYFNYKNCVLYESEGCKPFVRGSIQFWNSKEVNTMYYAPTFVLKMEAVHFSETFVSPIRPRNQNSNHNMNRHENL
jgi:hypothetical protein